MADMLLQSDEIQEALGHYATPDIDESELAAKLEDLGDEIWGDEDSTYLDDAMRTPFAQDREPRVNVNNKVNNLIDFIPY